MLTLLALATSGGAVVLGVRWCLRRTDALGRRVRFPAVAVVALLVMSGLAATPGVRRAHLEASLSRVASELAGRPVAVRCQGLAGALVDAGREQGWVRWRPDGEPEPVVHVDWEQCRLLWSFRAADGVDRPFAEHVAVHLLTHEAMHAAGEKDEARAECQAVQRDAVTAALLGAPPHAAAALARSYWAEGYPGMPVDYRSSDCGPGGLLDEELASAPW